MHILAGDIGGTNTRLAIYKKDEAGSCRLLSQAKYSSSAFHGLAPILQLFLGGEGLKIHAAACGVAGPVQNNQCTATNLPWKIDGNRLGDEMDIPGFSLINDFHAIAMGIDALPPESIEVLQQGEPDQAGTRAIIGAGTGLGQAIATPEASTLPGTQSFRILPSEGGHTDFAPRNEVEIELLRFLLKRHARVSYERVISGPGLITLYEFLVSRLSGKESFAIREAMQKEDPAAVIGKAALERSDETCLEAVRIFASLYGAEAGNLALKVLPTGGLFVAGGIAPKILPLILEEDRFLQSFLHKGRMSPLLEKMRVSIIKDTSVGLLGAREFAYQMTKN